MEQVNSPQWIFWGLSEAWLSGKVLGELKVELGETLPWRTGWVALGAWAASVGQLQRPPDFWRRQGLAPQPNDASSSELLSFHDLISLLGCVNHELTVWECTFRWLPLRSLLVPISTELTSTSVHSQFSTEKPRVTELQARCD